MTPAERAAVLADAIDEMVRVSQAHDDAGYPVAAEAALDQALACERDARVIAGQSGDAALMRWAASPGR